MLSTVMSSIAVIMHPFVNVNGEVIGINSSKLVGDSVEGIGYAIPISDVGDLIENLMNRETKTKVAEDKRGLIGITGISVSDAFSHRFPVYLQSLHLS